MANGDAENIPEVMSKPALARNVQAHLGRASTFPNGRTRDWSLFFFFRILPRAEMERDFDQLKKVMAAVKAQDSELAELEGQKLLAALHNPSTVNAGVLDQAKAQNDEAADAPAPLFLDWLKVVTGARPSALAETLRDGLVECGIPDKVFEPDVPGSSALQPTGPGTATASCEVAGEAVSLSSTSSRRIFTDRKVAVQTLMGLWQELRPMPAMLADPSKFTAYLQTFGKSGPEAGLKALQGGLRTVVFYELLRQAAPAQWKSDAKTVQHAVMRCEEDEQQSEVGRSKEPTWDPTPINVAFTYSGLQALKLDPVTLSSFPEVFKEGMAARAERLGDTGPSAPEHWEGVLGLDRVHGYFTGGFQVGSDTMPVPEKFWQTLREQVRAYNDRSSDKGQELRAELRAYFKLLGMDILHIELGQDPYEVDGQKNVKRLPYRMEHFGFRDGISQPFVDLKLGAPPSGGGTPRRNRTWSPLAAGEIFLDQPDEDGNSHKLPANELLRRGSTFLVFRKLEQDVAGFRTFLAKQRPKKRDQRKLAAQFVGRWQNGAPLVLAPDAPLDFGDDGDEVINNFLYAADDPMGAKCPLGAHVRRANPRDIGATNDVRRHRILRRGIAYGGPLLDDKVIGDGNKRGLLFVAANSRIDLQFEVIQANWMNKGELLGQAGLNRCPLTGANQGGTEDAFLEAGAVAAVTGLPRFVITRGGDYFFVPGVEPLKALADGCKFEAEKLPYLGYSLAGASTPKLFREDRIKKYGEEILSRKAPSIVRVELPAAGIEGVRRPTPAKSASAAATGAPQAAKKRAVPAPMVSFVGQLEDVRQVLSMGVGPEGSARKKIIYSASHYRAAVHRFSFGRDMLVSTELGSDTEGTRRRMKTILETAWGALGPIVYADLDDITKDSIEAALRATEKSGRIDLVHDLASAAVYNVLVKLYGTPGPDYLTELAVSLPFSHQHVGKLQPDWLSAAQMGTPDNVGLVTLQIWSILIFLDIVGNYEQQPELSALSGQAASELLAHLSTLIEKARVYREEEPRTLLAAFVHLEPKFVKDFNYSSADYYTDVRMLLLELVGTTTANIPAAMGSVMDAVLNFNIPLTELIPILTEPPAFLPPDQKVKRDEGIYRLIYETTRLNCFIKVLMRTCMQDHKLPSGGEVKKGDVVAALLGVASFDPVAFPQPMLFSLFPYLPGPKRNLDDYLLFGATATNRDESRDCWGREKLALKILKECVKAAGRLQHLQRVAGPAGKAKTLAGIVIGLSARFSGVRPNRW